MAIYDETGASSGSSSVGVSGATQVEVTPTDAFAKGDLVFLDYQANTINNLKNEHGSLALAAGPASLTFGTLQQSQTVAHGARLDLPDSTFVIVAASSAGANTYTVVATRYDLRGVVLNRNILESPSGNSDMKAFNIALLSNGNIGLTYLKNSANVVWHLLNQTLQSLATGTATTTYYIQETNDGGFFIVHISGITKVNADGTTNFTPYTIGQTAMRTEDNDNQANAYSTRCYSFENRKPIPLSGGGYAVIFSRADGVTLVRLNADGSARGAPVILASWGGQGVQYTHAAQSSDGNICWAVGLASNAGYYGIVGDDGSIIKAATTLSPMSNAGGQLIKLVANAAGDFVLMGSDSTPNWNILQMTSSGVARATFPKLLTVVTHNSDTRVVRLSTGILVICAQTLYELKTFFIANDGTIGAAKTLWKFGGGNSFTKIATTIYNDKVYGVASSGAGGNCDMVVFTIDNAGVPDAAPQFTGVTLPMSGGSSNASPWILMDPTNLYFHVAASGVIGTYTLDKQTVQTYTGAGTQSGYKYKMQNYTLVMHDSSGSVASNVVSVLAVKMRSTVLLGVAVAAAAAGVKMLVNTKGIFNTNYKANRTFDHASNNPPGNAGFVSNGLISLKGF